jgi:hypothetical protein
MNNLSYCLVLHFILVWAVGLIVSLLGGHFVTGWFVDRLRDKYSIEIPSDVKDAEKQKKGIPAKLTGPVERFFFTILVAYDVSGTAIAMIGWITVKMYQKLNKNENKSYAFSRLLGGLVSMLFALICGRAIRFFTSLC